MSGAVLHAPLHPDLRQALVTALGRPALDALPIALVVPTMALGRDLVTEQARLHGFSAGVRCFTPADLAHAVVAPERRPVLGAEARSWLVRRLQGARGRAPTSFDPVLDRRGIQVALLRAFETLGRAGLATRADLERALVRGGMELPLQARHALELALAWRLLFESTHDDPAGMMARAARAPQGRCGQCVAQRVWWFGFDTLSGVEQRLLVSLATDPDVDVRVFVPEDGSPVDALLHALRDVGFAIESPPRHAAARHAVETRLLACPSAESEAEEVARQLLAAADDGMRFERMAVQVPNIQRLDRLRDALPRRGIPCVFTPGRSLQSSRAGRAVVFFLDLAAGPLAADAALAYLAVAPLQQGWGGLPADITPSAWERAARAAGIGSGIEDWQLKLGHAIAAAKATADQQDAQSEPSQRAVAEGQAASELLAAGVALEAERASFPPRGRWGEFVTATETLLSHAFEPGEEIDALHVALARLRLLEHWSTTAVTLAQYREAVRSLLAETRLESKLEPGAVHVGTAGALQGLAFDLVCLTGVEEGEWPGRPLHDPILRERERAALRGLLPAAGTLGQPEDDIERQRRLFWRACAAARRRLVLTYARLDPISGAECLPSPLLLELASSRQGHAVDFDALLALPWVERVPLHRTTWPEALPELGLDEIDVVHVLSLPRIAARRYVGGLGVSARRGLALDHARNSVARFTSVDGMLGTRAALEALAARFARPSFSATQLTTYLSCPLRYFWRYVLRVEPLDREDRRDLSALEAGRLAHGVLEAFYTALSADSLPLEAVDDDTLVARLRAAAAPVFRAAEERGRTGARLLWSIRRQRLLEDLQQFLRLERRRATDRFVPVAFEARFGRGTRMPVVVRNEAGDGIELKGAIDRLDREVDGQGVRVIDYKAGRLPGEAGVVQLVIYLWAATGGDAARLVASEAEFVSVTRRGAFARRRLVGRALASRQGDVVHLVHGVAAALRAGRFPPVPGAQAAHCEWCDYKTHCEARVGEQSERKAAGGQLAAFAALPTFVALEANS